MTNEEQLLQEARKEAEKVYPFKKGNDFSKGFNSEIVKINLDLLNKQTIFIKGYIANAKKQMSEAVEFVQWIITNDNKIDVTLTVEQVYDLYLQQQKQ